MITYSAIKPSLFERDTTKNISPSYDDRDLERLLLDEVDDFFREK